MKCLTSIRIDSPLAGFLTLAPLVLMTEDAWLKMLNGWDVERKQDG